MNAREGKKSVNELNKLIESGQVVKINDCSYPSVGDCRVTFYRNVNDAGGWVKIDERYVCAFEVDQSVIDEADEIEFDCYNSARYSCDLINLAETLECYPFERNGTI